VWAAIWGYLLFHDVPTVVVMIGAAIVVSSGLAVVLSERNNPG
jgi:drug/metabolite transporter (DMT)-like permease